MNDLKNTETKYTEHCKKIASICADSWRAIAGIHKTNYIHNDLHNNNILVLHKEDAPNAPLTLKSVYSESSTLGYRKQ